MLATFIIYNTSVFVYERGERVLLFSRSLDFIRFLGDFESTNTFRVFRSEKIRRI